VSDHPTALRQFFNALNPGGQLAVQIPANFDHPSHRVADEVAAEDPFRDRLSGYPRRNPVHTPEDYAQVLYHLGFSRQSVSLRVYAHVLESADHVIEWVQGTLLTPIKARLDPSEYSRFLERYRQALLPRLADERPFLYTFKRILFWAAKPVP
jgi:trans-aconitate 2-methyltransferase